MKSKYRTTSVRAVILQKDQVLVEWFEPKQISFLPGGTLENNEDLKLALIRELEEELLGISLEVGQYLGKIGHIWKTDFGEDSCLNHFYEVTILTNEGVKAREFGRQIRWLTLNPEELSSVQPPKLRELLLNLKPSNSWNYVDSEVA